MDEAVEVFDPEGGRATGARGGGRIRAGPRGAWAAALVLLGIFVTLGYARIQRAEVYLSDYAIPLSFLDGEIEVVLDGAPTDESRRLAAALRPGFHVLHYDVADGVRHYAELPVERGENRIRPDWMESRLPALYRDVALGQSPVTASRSQEYFFYDRDAGRVDRSAELTLYLAVETEPTDPTKLLSTVSWRLALDGAVVADRMRRFRTAIESGEPVEERIDLYADDHHRYWVEARFERRFAHLELSSAFVR